MSIERSSSTAQSRRGIVWAYGTRSVARGLIALLMLQGAMAADAQQQPAQQQQPSTPPQSRASNAEQTSAPPMMPGETPANRAEDSLPSAPVPQASQQQAPAQAAGQQQPVGTAAAPYEKPTGVPGSRPAGAVIAPAKQRRVRAIVISIGIVLAAGAAVGAVVGLSKASHSQPQ